MKKSNKSFSKALKKASKNPLKTVSQDSGGQILIYQTEGGRTKFEVRLEGETVRLTQKSMAELYQTSTPNINIHIQNIYNEGELEPKATVKESLTTAPDGKKHQTKFYNLYSCQSPCRYNTGFRPASHPFCESP